MLVTAGTRTATGDAVRLGDRARARGLWGDAFRRLLRNRGAVIGMVILGLLTLMAIFAPLIAPDEPNFMVPTDALAPPSLEHLFGTDQFGRDILSRIIYGARLSLQVGFVAVGIASRAPSRCPEPTILFQPSGPKNPCLP